MNNSYQTSPEVTALFHRRWQRLHPPRSTEERLRDIAAHATAGHKAAARAAAMLKREALLVKLTEMASPGRRSAILDLQAWDGYILKDAIEHHNHYPAAAHPFDVAGSKSPATLSGIITTMFMSLDEVKRLNSHTGAASVQRAVHRAADRLLDIPEKVSQNLHLRFCGSDVLDDAIRGGQVNMTWAVAVAGNLCESGLGSWEICVPKDTDWMINTADELLGNASWNTTASPPKRTDCANYYERLGESAFEFLKAAEACEIEFAGVALEDGEMKLLTKTADPGDFPRWRWLTMPEPLIQGTAR